jgi:hypothetical protein
MLLSEGHELSVAIEIIVVQMTMSHHRVEEEGDLVRFIVGQFYLLLSRVASDHCQRKSHTKLL